MFGLNDNEEDDDSHHDNDSEHNNEDEEHSADNDSIVEYLVNEKLNEASDANYQGMNK